MQLIWMHTLTSYSFLKRKVSLWWLFWLDTTACLSATFCQFPCCFVVNCMYWEGRFPRLLNTMQFQDLMKSGCPLVGISDITCDVGGSIEFINQTTSLDSPFFRYTRYSSWVFVIIKMMCYFPQKKHFIFPA